MNQLQQGCLAVVPMTEAAIQAIYDFPAEMTAKDVRHLCLSHERLRAELAGAQAMYWELTKTNSPAMRSRKRKLTYHEKRVLGTLVYKAKCTKVSATGRGVRLYGDDTALAKNLVSHGLVMRSETNCETLWWPSPAGIDYWTNSLTPSEKAPE